MVIRGLESYINLNEVAWAILIGGALFLILMYCIIEPINVLSPNAQNEKNEIASKKEKAASSLMGKGSNTDIYADTDRNRS